MKVFTHAHVHTFGIEELGFGEKRSLGINNIGGTTPPISDNQNIDFEALKKKTFTSNQEVLDYLQSIGCDISRLREEQGVIQVRASGKPNGRWVELTVNKNVGIRFTATTHALLNVIIENLKKPEDSFANIATPTNEIRSGISEVLTVSNGIVPQFPIEVQSELTAKQLKIDTEDFEKALKEGAIDGTTLGFYSSLEMIEFKLQFEQEESIYKFLCYEEKNNIFEKYFEKKQKITDTYPDIEVAESEDLSVYFTRLKNSENYIKKHREYNALYNQYFTKDLLEKFEIHFNPPINLEKYSKQHGEHKLYKENDIKTPRQKLFEFIEQNQDKYDMVMSKKIIFPPIRQSFVYRS